MLAQTSKPRKRRAQTWCLAAGVLLTAVPASSLAADGPPPPGNMIAVADTSLHLLCDGSGAPTVLLEAGMGGNYLDWTLVQPMLAGRVRVCAYDRAGMGFSARTARPRTAAAMNEELHVLIAAAGLPVPVLLVGHSFGGMLALGYARRYPQEVAGLVLLDAMHPRQFARFAANGIDLPTDPHLILGRTPASAALYHLPPDLHEIAIALAQSDKQRVFEVREMAAMPVIAETVDAGGYPQLPTRVLVHGDREWDAAYPDGRMERVWMALQDELATRTGAPPPQVVAGAGRQIALDAPEAVTQAVVGLIAALPPGGTSRPP